MADDRYSWLDKDAAERLLRGEPAGSQVGDGARELEHLLKAAAAAGSGLPETAALPGEEAALAAFRQTRHDAGAHPREAGRGAALSAVRGGRGSRVAERNGLARPFRRGFAVALAVCAIGGIAVAAGTGVLPTPFRGGEPQPGASVSAAETPSTFETQESATSPGETGRTPATQPDGRPTGPGATPTPSPGSSQSAGPAPGTRTPGTGTPGDDSQSQQDQDGKNKKRLLLALCKDYESGKRGDLDRDTLRSLESKAGGPNKVHAFCRQYLTQAGQQGGGSGDNDGGGGGRGGGGGGQGGNGDGGGHNGGGGGDEEGDPSGVTPPSPSAPPAGTTPAPDPSTPAPTPTGTLPTGPV
ncbi:hypothetical protein AB0C11_02935 [Streptomyces sp. NPDC039016]|uniref:hypothetical protein n=1 Tax=unclassified Streptomyces TaxID=2593676 RepID=UPI000CC7E374|nr:hypothetical protein [Streptomyces sp. CB02959]PJN37097.1 hypothetical protein CG747_29820 [Streptomyces sp. CB02959]